MKSFEVYRYDPDSGENPRLDTFEVDLDDCGLMVLNALFWIKNHVDSTLTFRRSCREGMCGSCAMNMDGTNLACLHAIHFRLGHAGNSLSAGEHEGHQGPGARSHARLCAIRDDRTVASVQDTGAREGTIAVSGGPKQARRLLRMHSLLLLHVRVPEPLVECDRFLGPAALIQDWRWLTDSRDEAKGERLDILEDPFRLYLPHNSQLHPDLS